MSKKLRVAIDGPVSSGKTTIGRGVAAALEYLFIDTGMMYRAVAWKVRRENRREDEWGKTAAGSRFEWIGDRAAPRLKLDGAEVGEDLSHPELAQLTSRVAAESAVRKTLVRLQRDMANNGGVVMVGRDIGLVVLPEAEI